jgi:hypothetical protein
MGEFKRWWGVAAAGLLLTGCQATDPTPSANIVDALTRSTANERCFHQLSDIGTATVCLPQGSERLDKGSFSLKTSPLNRNSRQGFIDFTQTPNLKLALQLNQDRLITGNEQLYGTIAIGETIDQQPRDMTSFAIQVGHFTPQHTFAVYWEDWRFTNVLLDSQAISDFSGRPILKRN